MSSFFSLIFIPCNWFLIFADYYFIRMFAYITSCMIIHPMTDGTFYFIASVKFDPDIFFHLDIPLPGVPGPPGGCWCYLTWKPRPHSPSKSQTWKDFIGFLISEIRTSHLESIAVTSFSISWTLAQLLSSLFCPLVLMFPTSSWFVFLSRYYHIDKLCQVKNALIFISFDLFYGILKGKPDQGNSHVRQEPCQLRNHATDKNRASGGL